MFHIYMTRIKHNRTRSSCQENSKYFKYHTLACSRTFLYKNICISLHGVETVVEIPDKILDRALNACHAIVANTIKPAGVPPCYPQSSEKQNRKFNDKRRHRETVEACLVFYLLRINSLTATLIRDGTPYFYLAKSSAFFRCSPVVAALGKCWPLNLSLLFLC